MAKEELGEVSKSPESSSSSSGWPSSSSVLRQRLAAQWSRSPGRWGAIGLIVGVVSFAAFAGWVWIERYLAFQTYAWDLGVYNQGFYTTWFDHRLFYYTPDLPSGSSGSVFATHFAPIFFPLLPLYAVSAGPPALLVIQAVALALGAVPLYFLARLYLSSDAWALLLAGIYLISPLTLGTGWYDFHPEALLPVTMLTAFYFFARQRVGWFVVSWVVTLSVIETAAAFLILFAGAVILGALWRIYRHRDASARPELRLATVGLVIAVGWLGLAFVVVSHLTTSGGTFGSSYAGNWAILGASTIYSVVPYAIAHPAAAWTALAYDGAQKLAFVILLFGAFAFLPFWGQRRYLVMVFGWLVLAVLSNERSYYVFGDQYLGYVLAPLAAGAVTGVHRLLNDVRWPTLRPYRVRGTVGGLIAAVVVTSALLSPVFPVSALSFGVAHGIPSQSSHDAFLHEVIDEIPPQASVLTTPAIFPEVSNRANAFVDPVGSFFVDNRTFSEWLGQYANESQYVLVDFLVDYSNSVLIEEYTNLTAFGLQAAVDGVYLYERGWTGPPNWFVPYTMDVPLSSLTLVAGELQNGVVAYRPNGVPDTEIWNGTGDQWVPPGSYAVTFSVRYSTSSAGPQLEFRAEQEQVQLEEIVHQYSGGVDYSFDLTPQPGNVTILGVSFVNGTPPAGDAFENVTVAAAWSIPGALYLPGIAVAANVSVDLLALSVEQLSAS